MRALAPPNLPGLEDIHLGEYDHRFGIDRLAFGVDNLRYDVHLSPGFVKATRKIVIHLVARASGVTDLPDFSEAFSWSSGESEFRGLCRDILTSAVKRARRDNEIQVLFLAEAALIAVFREAVLDRYKACIQHLNGRIWNEEMAYNHDKAVELQEHLQNLTRQREAIVRSVNRGLLRYLSDTLVKDGANELFALHFGPDPVLPDDFFTNPLLHAENPEQDEFMLEEYVLLGSRQEDANRYETILATLRPFFAALEGPSPDPVALPPSSAPTGEAERAGRPAAALPPRHERWLRHTANMDVLFNVFRTEQVLRKAKKSGEGRERLQQFRNLQRAQGRLLGNLLKVFHQNQVLPTVVAMHELKAVYDPYCPPLTPHEVLQFLVDRKSRKTIRTKLKRISRNTGEVYPLPPLRRSAARVRRCAKGAKQARLIEFLKSFSRYYRDRTNYDAVQQAIQYINFVADEKLLTLSRANNTLYEFLLPHEDVPDERPIISHAVVKADVRGSTGIVSQMKSKGLNAATNFSLNLFDPITEILSRYGAFKVFIEGDAMILSIFEYEEKPENWYSVARACGLAMNILLIVQRYNIKNQRNQLPHLELGIGISYTGTAPTFFFDAEQRIMISPAINQADRLSGCFRPLREKFGAPPPFNVYVYRVVDDDRRMVSEEWVRYNVNGIELSEAAFQKLRKEIQLRTLKVQMPGEAGEKVLLHIGTVPTMSGMFQQVVVREAPIQWLALRDLSPQGATPQKYYEVCTHPALLRAIRRSGPGESGPAGA
jgi:hypothetical protein